MVTEPSSLVVKERELGALVVLVGAIGEEVGALAELLCGTDSEGESFAMGSTSSSTGDDAVEEELSPESPLISCTRAATPNSKAIVRTSSLDWFGTTPSRVKITCPTYGNAEPFKAVFYNIDPGRGPTLKE
tara:strand:- start:13474 stop:13866 length:393 start_codon:yes stop_codon:yes gene_type:complete